MKKLALATILLSVLMAGCGGGGSDQSSFTVTLNPNTLSATFPGNEQSLSIPGADVIASVNPSISEPVYAYVIDDKGVIVPGALGITENTNGSYTVHLNFNKSLAAGTYTGTLALKLCKDAGCTATYSINGGTLPYTVTVTPGIQIIGATINGVATSPSSLNVKSGDVVTLQSNAPVSWTTGQSGVILSGQSETSTQWSATLGYGLSTPGGTGMLSVTATTLSSPNAQVVTNINVVQ